MTICPRDRREVAVGSSLADPNSIGRCIRYAVTYVRRCDYNDPALKKLDPADNSVCSLACPERPAVTCRCFVDVGATPVDAGEGSTRALSGTCPPPPID